MPTGEAFSKVLERAKTAFFVTGAVFLTCFAAWASGITVPANSKLNVANGELKCELGQPCNIVNNGIIQTTTGAVRLNGDWTTSGTGYYDSGTGTVFFAATAGVQTITPGVNASDAFFHLNHVGVGTVAVSTNPLNINGNFNNVAGSFNAAGMTMNVAGHWNNVSPEVLSFVPNNNTVNLVGLDQAIYGDNTFYNLEKHLTAAPSRTLVFEANRQQTIIRSLALRGVDGANRLNLVSSNPGSGAVPNALNSARLQLTYGGIQRIDNVAVSDSDARGGVTLVGRPSSQSDGRNQNWLFGSVTLTWDGSDNESWSDPFNWDLGIVPTAGDTAVIPAAPARQPVLDVDGVNVGTLEIAQNASLTLNQHDMTVTGVTTNTGTMVLAGTETFTTGALTQNPTSVFKYVGVAAAGAFAADFTTNFIVGGAPLLSYQGLTIDGQIPASDTFTMGTSLGVLGNATFTHGYVTLAAGTTLTVGGTVLSNGALVDAHSGSLVLNNFTLTDGSFTAPVAAGTFSMTGDFTRTNGTFDPGDGTLTLIGGNQSIIGDVGFYGLVKQVADPYTLFFGAGTTVLVSHQLTLRGLDATHQLSINSSNLGVMANLGLLSTGAQDIANVVVRDNDARPGVLLYGRPVSSGVAGTYENWKFDNVTITWTGAVSNAWAVPFNWDIGTVPIAGDAAVIASTASTTHHQPILATDVTVGSMDVRANASLTLNGHDFTAQTAFVNSGDFILNGNESLNIPLPYDPMVGTFIYRGDGVGTSTFDITGGGVPTGRPSRFFNLTIENPLAGNPSSFTVDEDLYMNGSFSISGGVTVDASIYSIDITGNFSMTGGTFTAPGSAESFQVAGNFTNTAGAGFIANGGTLTLDGADMTGPSIQVLSGDTTFCGLDKTVTALSAQIRRLTLDAASTQTVTCNLSLHGYDGDHLLQLFSSNTPEVPSAATAAKLVLQPGGLQQISYMDVWNSDASGPVSLVARTSPDHLDVDSVIYNNTNWIFGTPTITWTGTVSEDWTNPYNWNFGLVPIAGDNVVVPVTAHQPHLTVDASLYNVTIESGATLSLDGHDFTMTGTLVNHGNVVLRGTEAVAIAVPDTDHGTFTYTGINPAVETTINLHVFGAGLTPLTYYNLVINAGALDVFVPDTNLVVKGGLTLSGGKLDASTRSLDVDGSLALNNANATLSAPQAGTFTVGGSWTNTAGNFVTNGGKVPLDGNNPATITGNTTFYDMAILVPTGGKTVYFTAGSHQTVQHTLDMSGNKYDDVLLRSTDPDGPNPTWEITTQSNDSPFVTNVDVQDSVAHVPAAALPRPAIIAFNAVDQQRNGVSTNTGWIFLQLDLIAPTSSRTVGQTPTLIGHNLDNEVVIVRARTVSDPVERVVAAARADANGNFRVVLGRDDSGTGVTIDKAALDVSVAAQDTTLTPYCGIYVGNSSSELTVVDSPATTQVPVIDTPLTDTLLFTTTPTITGRAKDGQSIQVVAYNTAGTMLLTILPEAYAGTGTVQGGNFSVTLSRALPRGVNYLSVLVDGVSSAVFKYLVNDVMGVVFDSGTNNPINGANVTILKSDGTMPVEGVDIAPGTLNPATTGPDGRYSFLTTFGNYKVVVEAAGYAFPTTLTDSELPAGRVIVLGSRGEVFAKSGDVQPMDFPLDPTPYLFKIEKKANKSEARVGEVVTYTVTMESLLDQNSILIPRLIDNIPPGFKFMGGRAQLDGIPLAEPEGSRPITFTVGDFAPHQKKILRYQLIIGSGVVPGGYENTAVMKYPNGARISNYSKALVNVVLDPLFDAGTVFGKVFYDWNENGRQDDPDYIAEDRQLIVEGPVPNVRLVMEDGTVVTADKNGQFHVPSLIPGRHLLRLDERSLPAGAYLTTDKVQVLDVTSGSIIKMNFGVNMDNAQIVGKDAQFFQKEFLIDQQPSQPKPRLNVNVFNDNILFHNDAVIEQIEFRMFMNYAPFITSWQMDIVDADTQKTVRSFKGTRSNGFDPVYWDGRDSSGKFIRAERKYAYVLKVKSDANQWDETKEQLLVLKTMTDAEISERQRQRSDVEKKQEASARSTKYRTFLAALVGGDALKVQNIWVKGDTIVLKSAAADVRQVRVLKSGELFTEVPVLERQGLTAHELLEGTDKESFVPMEVILPDGDYELEVASARGLGKVEGGAPSGSPVMVAGAADVVAKVVEPVSVATQRYKRQLKVGQDYVMFVAMGDGKAGYNMNKGSIEPIQNSDKYLPGFYSEGKMAYYLKGKIKGKYVVTSSFDTERQTKEALKAFKDEQYYPIYGDASTVNYDATNTEGPLYLSIEWDKSQAIWGNYAVAFNNTEFANYTRTLYGGKLDYKTVASIEYGEPKTNVVVFHAETRQRSAHNEFLGTGGSLYYLRNQDVVSGTDKLRVEVRDSITGLVKSTVDIKENVDYDLDYATGRVLFWRPVSMIVDNNHLISNGLLNGDPVYVVADYEYFVNDQLAEATQGVRVAQAVGKNVVAGVTYVTETQASRDYQLKGEDVTVHLGKESTVQAEYAQTASKGQNSFMSTDGGITFSALASSSDISGKAYGIKQDARLFDRVGLKSYYKWIDAGYSTGDTASQQGKELAGLALTFDLTPVTRLTASRDVQRLIDQGNIQTVMQVGAQETITTIVQVVHDARRLRLTYGLQSNEVRNKSEGYTSTTNTQAATAAFQAEYALNPKTDLVFQHQQNILGTPGQSTTLGVKRQLTNKLRVNIEETFGTAGLATKAGVTANVTPRLALSTDYTLTKAPTGEMLHTMTVAGKGNINDKTSLQTALSLTQQSAGMTEESTAAVGFATKVGEDASVTAGVETSQSSTAGRTRQALSLGGTRHGKEGRESTTGVKIEDNLANGGKTTVITAGEKGTMKGDMQVATDRSFGFGAKGVDSADTYKIARVKDGRVVETSYARKRSDSAGTVSDANIFGLTGDVNDRVALQGSLEKGKVQNPDGTVTDRVVFSGGVGYVEKSTEPGASPVFTSSTKAEVRFDHGSVDKQQYVFYQSAEGKVNDQTTVKGKFSYSTTINKETKKAEAGYKEIMLGAAYRPIAMDRLNVFGQYTYKENKGPASQATATDVEATKMHVVTAGAAFELNEKWELVEKLAMRIMQEKVAGFEFAKTHTWLLVNRANYSINQDWKLGAEYRMLTVREAGDRKTGFLVEAVHGMNNNIELGVGYNFTNFVDDLTDLGYTVQGPFIRMTGKLYDQSPEERARAKARWLDHRVDLYAKKMIKDELMRRDGPLVMELNKMYQEAQSANARGKYEDARQLYKNIILATQMMYEEAAQFVRHHIAWEEGIYNAFQRAKEYYDKGDFWQARKLWEKIVEEASKAVLEYHRLNR